MQILLISGFLGAGKTEFIKTLVGATRKQCVVLENEYGEINFDSGRLKDIKTQSGACIAMAPQITVRLGKHVRVTVSAGGEACSASCALKGSRL